MQSPSFEDSTDAFSWPGIHWLTSTGARLRAFHAFLLALAAPCSSELTLASLATPRRARPHPHQAARTLTRLVLNKDYSNDYLYYGIPTPWLQIKLLRMLQVIGGGHIRNKPPHSALAAAREVSD